MSEDYLPKPPPPQNAVEKKSGPKTILIWIVLIVLFVAIYQLASGPPGPGAHATPEPPTRGVETYWVLLAFIVGAALPIAFMVWQLRGSVRFNSDALAAQRAAADGDLKRAADLYRALLQRYRRKVAFTAAAGYGVGHTLLRLGELDDAAAALIGVERTPALPYTSTNRALAAIELARLFAVAGDTDKARRWLENARTRHEKSSYDSPRTETGLVTVEAWLACREGRYADALRALEHGGRWLEANLTVAAMREVWLLRAFATASTTGPREADTAEPWLRLVRGAAPGELDWMWVKWPELAAFARTHQLPSRAAA